MDRLTKINPKQTYIALYSSIPLEVMFNLAIPKTKIFIWTVEYSYELDQINDWLVKKYDLIYKTPVITSEEWLQYMLSKGIAVLLNLTLEEIKEIHELVR